MKNTSEMTEQMPPSKGPTDETNQPSSHPNFNFQFSEFNFLVIRAFRRNIFYIFYPP
jgi:hypothetical protein